MVFFPVTGADPSIPAQTGTQFLPVGNNGPFSFFSHASQLAALTVDPAAYTMGIEWKSSVAGFLYGVWFSSPSGAAILPGNIALYAVTGPVQVANQAAAWSGAVGSGWVEALFSSPIAITPNTNYKACIFKTDAVNNFYGSISNYFTTGPGQNGLTSGPCTAYNNAGADVGQDSFFGGAGIAYPNTSFNATNYGVDIDFRLT